MSPPYELIVTSGHQPRITNVLEIRRLPVLDYVGSGSILSLLRGPFRRCLQKAGALQEMFVCLSITLSVSLPTLLSAQGLLPYLISNSSETELHLWYGERAALPCSKETLVKEASHKRPHIVWFHLYEVSRTGKSIETGSRLVTAYGWEGGEGRRVTAKGYKISLGDDENILKLTVVIVAQLWTY